MSLSILIGPMFAGKSTELLRRLYRDASIGTRCLYVNSSKDTRKTSTEYSTHNPLYASLKSGDHGVYMISVNNLSEICAYIGDYQIIGIDEAQFFTDLYDSVKFMVDTLGKHVIVTGLDGTFQREKFGHILDIVPLCDNIEKLTAKCKCGKDAIFTYRKTSCNDVEEIGGKEIYDAKCRTCYNEGSKRVITSG